MKRILSVALVILCTFFLSVLKTDARDIKFVQITDVHYKKSSPILIKMIKDINQNSDIDFVVFCGDNIGQANPKNLNAFLNDVKKLNKPCYFVLGDKDVSKTNQLGKTDYLKMVRKINHLHPKTPNYIFKKNDIVFIVVDGSKEIIPGANGVYSKETIAWIDNQLNKYAYNKVVILQHFPIANKPTNDFYYTYNALEYLQMLSKHNNVIAVISGHFHKNDEIMYNNVYHITSPQASNGLYKIIEIDADNGYEVFTILKDVK